ncbi:hypothetical protein [uncultured Roseibium sp.]|uniref:hypothetical protein n=1 Tax=uncultured Roseibium sp. TaxID=1936171 RepID=UPI002609CBAB|nr:hypothetical protein [uncultured Roseibium sp.]
MPTSVLAAQRSKSRRVKSCKFNGHKVVSPTAGAVARIGEIYLARSSASVSLLLDTPGQQHSRMDETAFLEENNTDTCDICAGNSASVGLRIVTAKRERNSMKPNLRQTSKDVGATNPNPVATAHAFEKQSASQSKPKHNEIGGRVSL